MYRFFGRLTATVVLALACTSLGIGLAPDALAVSRGTVEGHVVDHKGNPVAGVNVVMTFNGKTLPSAKTDVDGHYAFTRVKPGVHLLWSEARSDYGIETYYGGTVNRRDARRVHVVAGETYIADITMAAVGSVTGRLVDSKGRGRRYVDAHSSYPWGYEEDNNGRLGSRRQALVGSTKKGGHFTFPDVLEGRQDIQFQVFPDEFGIKTSLSIYYIYAPANVRAGRTVDLGTLRLPKFNGTIRGTVKLSNTHRGSFYSVVLRNSRGHQVAAAPVNSRTGEVRFTQVPAGKYRVEIPGVGIARSVVVKSGKVAQFKSVNARLSTLTGKITATRKNARNCVRYEDKFGHGDYHCLSGNGTYSLRGLGVGTHRVYVSGSYSPGSGREWGRAPYFNDSVRKSFLVKVRKNGSIVRKNIEIDTYGRTVTGRISPQGRGAEVVYVALAVGGEPDYPLQQRITRADKDGAFKITTVGPQKGRYLLVDKFGLVIAEGKIKRGVKDVRLGTIKVH